MAPRARGRPAKVNTQAAQLAAALDFVSVATDDHEMWHKHVTLGDRYAIAHNGQMAAGHPIEEDLACCPHIGQLKSAIAKCGKSLAIVQTPGGKLSIKGDKLNALVPCLGAEYVPVTGPDGPEYPLDGEPLKEAFKVCGTLATEAATEVIQASLLLGPNECASTNRQIVLQYWHGINMPPNAVIPKVFAAAVAKQTKKIVGFGFRWLDDQAQNKVGRMTFYFEDRSWIASLCYSDDWPPLEHLFKGEAFPVEPPVGLFEGMAAVSDFHDNGYCTFGDGKIMSHRSDMEGAQYDVPGLQAGKQFGAKAFLKVAPLIKTIDFTTFATKAMFFGEKLRGCIASIVESGEGPIQQQIQPQGQNDAPQVNDENASQGHGAQAGDDGETNDGGAAYQW